MIHLSPRWGFGYGDVVRFYTLVAPLGLSGMLLKIREIRLIRDNP